MIHEMELNDKPFRNILLGVKKIELRLYDETTENICIDDFIIFTNATYPDETIKIKVKGLLRYKTFYEMFKDVDYNICGPAESLEQKLDNIHKIYSIERENAKGVLGISMELVQN